MGDTTCVIERTQKTSAQRVVDEKTADFQKANAIYLACQGPTAQGAAALQSVAGEMADIQKDVDVIQKVQSVVLKQLGREARNSGVLTSMSDIAADESTKAQQEIDELRSAIRRERRLFLDADPSAPTSVIGLYYTREPDNQVLIAFIVCFSFFLLFVGLLILNRLIPIPYLLGLDAKVNEGGYSERLQVVGGFWILSLFVAYLCFFTFT